MTEELQLKNSNLLMPIHYVELDNEEMSYVDGGISTSAVANIIDIGLLAIAGAINASLRVAGFMGRGAAKKFILKKAPTWAKQLGKASSAIFKADGIGSYVRLAIGTLTDISPWVDRIVTLCSLGGIVATILDISDGCWDGYIDF